MVRTVLCGLTAVLNKSGDQIYNLFYSGFFFSFSSNKVNWIRTSDNIAGDGVSTVASAKHGLNAVGVLSSRNQTGNINTSRVRGLFSGRLAFLAGEHRQLGRRSKHRLET